MLLGKVSTYVFFPLLDCVRVLVRVLLLLFVHCTFRRCLVANDDELDGVYCVCVFVPMWDDVRSGGACSHIVCSSKPHTEARIVCMHCIRTRPFSPRRSTPSSPSLTRKTGFARVLAGVLFCMCACECAGWFTHIHTLTYVVAAAGGRRRSRFVHRAAALSA